MKNIPSSSDYEALVADIGRIYETARQGLVKAYWKIGRRIVEVEQDGSPRASYGHRLLARLSTDLSGEYGSGFSVNNLQRMRGFYLEHPKYPAPDILTWTHYAEIQGIEDHGTRRQLERQVKAEHLSTRAVRELVRQKTGRAPRDTRSSEVVTPNVAPLPARRLRRPSNMKFRSYREADASDIVARKGHIGIDCGFNLYRDVPKSTSGYELTSKPSYTYPATVKRVVDGDTVWTLIYIGFHTVLRRKLRLHGVNAPEATTTAGKAATDYVAGLLPPGAAIVIRSYAADGYGRYLADIFCPKEPIANPTTKSYQTILSDGMFLNQSLLTRGLAVRTVL